MTHATPPAPWLQTSIHLTDPADAERMCAKHLGPQMQTAVEDGFLDNWFFIRKSPWWRLRYRPAPRIPTATARQHVADLLTNPETVKYLGATVHQIYEPETTAFGGPAAMDIAHQLFSADSKHIADYLAITDPSGTSGPRRELSLLLTTAFARAAGQEWYEQGDIWAKIATFRGSHPALAPYPDKTALAVHRFLTADPDTTTTRLTGPLANLTSSWTDTFRSAGSALRALADQGRLERGLRAVIAHHVVFHWNRLGLAFTEQQRLARAARDAVFADPNLINIGQPSPQEARSTTS